LTCLTNTSASPDREISGFLLPEICAEKLPAPARPGICRTYYAAEPSLSQSGVLFWLSDSLIKNACFYHFMLH